MKRYVKFGIDEKAFQTPTNQFTPAGMIWGYGTEQNEAQLLEDGWLVYEGSLPLYMLEFSDGQIVEVPPDGYKPSTAVEPYELEAQDLTGTQICTARKLSGDYLDDVRVIRLL